MAVWKWSSATGVGSAKLATISGGTETTYSDGNLTWNQYALNSNGSLTVVSSGWVETILALAGGGGGNSGSNDNAYPGGGGGAGGAFFRRWVYLEAQTITATIGAGGTGGWNTTKGGPGTAGYGGDTTFTIAGFGDTPGSLITCGGGGGGAQQGGGAGNLGRAGVNGGGTGGQGGIGSSPGISATSGTQTLTNFWLNRAASQYAIGTGGESLANYGRGGSSAGTGNGRLGGSGVFLIRVPSIAL